MRARGLTAAQLAVWQRKTEEVVLALGATPDENDNPAGYRSFVLETRYGLLRLFPRGTAIRSRFEVVPAVALHGPEVNRFSGKWNFEFGPVPTDAELAWASTCLQRVLPA